jgi:peptidoglycan/LPS O-acetylase OafA/YrhL
MLDPSNGGTAVDSAAAGPSGGLASAVPRRSAGWRADIDGLRAVGVLAVIVFHLRKRWLPGGFAGVDVFFVISGFLITRAIVEDLSAGVFSRTEFYRRRVKRISLPMLAVVLATVAFAQVALLPKDALATAWSGVAAVLSGANVYFWRALDRSYFAPGTDEVPLLHLWSLGVEEQFYLLWPWVVPWILGRRGTAHGGASGLAAHVEDESPRRDAATASLPAGRMALMAAVALASFLLGDALFGSAPYFAYYMLPTRVGELLVGAILAFAVAGGALQAPGSLLREAAGAAGARAGLARAAVGKQAVPGMARARADGRGGTLAALRTRDAERRVSRALPATARRGRTRIVLRLPVALAADRVLEVRLPAGRRSRGPRDLRGDVRACGGEPSLDRAPGAADDGLGGAGCGPAVVRPGRGRHGGGAARDRDPWPRATRALGELRGAARRDAPGPPAGLRLRVRLPGPPGRIGTIV